MRAAPVTSATFASFALAAACLDPLRGVGRAGRVRRDGPTGGERPTLVDTFPDRGYERVRRDAARGRLARQGRDRPAATASSCRARATRPARSRARGSRSPIRTAAARRASPAPTWTRRAVAGRRRSICRSSPCRAEPGRHTLDAPAAARRRSRAPTATSSRSARRRTRSSSRTRSRRHPTRSPKPTRRPRGAARGVGRARARRSAGRALGARRRGARSRGWSTAG